MVEGLVELRRWNREPSLVEDKSLLKLVDPGMREARDAICFQQSVREREPEPVETSDMEVTLQWEADKGILLKYPLDQL